MTLDQKTQSKSSPNERTVQLGGDRVGGGGGGGGSPVGKRVGVGVGVRVGVRVGVGMLVGIGGVGAGASQFDRRLPVSLTGGCQSV